MKGVLLAAGFGTRLKKINVNMSKGLIPYHGKPLITHIVNRVPENLSLYVHTNKLFEADYRDWQKSLARKIELSVEPTRDPSEALGAVGSINYFIQEKKIDDDLLVLATDNYFEFDVADFISHFNGEHPLVALYDIKDLEKAKNFGVVTVKDSRIIHFQEKPEHPESSLVSIACYIFPRHMMAEIKKFCSRGTRDNLGDFIRHLLTILPVEAYVFTGPWFDIGNETDYNEIIKGQNK
jgi:glucose-1-phosphate thymidylyltransferase